MIKSYAKSEGNRESMASFCGFLARSLPCCGSWMLAATRMRRHRAQFGDQQQESKLVLVPRVCRSASKCRHRTCPGWAWLGSSAARRLGGSARSWVPPRSPCGLSLAYAGSAGFSSESRKGMLPRAVAGGDMAARLEKACHRLAKGNLSEGVCSVQPRQLKAQPQPQPQPQPVAKARCLFPSEEGSEVVQRYIGCVSCVRMKSTSVQVAIHV